MRASIVLTPAESKRLIAKAIVQKSDIKKAMEKAYVILCEGSTNVMIAQELFGMNIACENFTCGMSVGRVLCASKPEARTTFPLVAYKGKIVDLSYEKAIEDFYLDTVIIKGGNAIDKDGLVGVIVAGYDGGVIAKIIGHAIHIASGGIGGSEGAVVLCCEGNIDVVNKTIEIVESIKGEPLQQGIRQKCNHCKYINCIFYGKRKKFLPKWMF